MFKFLRKFFKDTEFEVLKGSVCFMSVEDAITKYENEHDVKIKYIDIERAATGERLATFVLESNT